MTAPFPHRYRVSLVGEGQGARIVARSRPDIMGGAPAEFDGRDDWWSPEALLLGSVSLCVETTFAAMARRKELEILEWTSHAEGVVDKTAQGLAFTSIHVKADLVVRSEDVERARALADVVGRHCLVGSSLKCPVTVAVDVMGRAAEPARAAPPRSTEP